MNTYSEQRFANYPPEIWREFEHRYPTGAMVCEGSSLWSGDARLKMKMRSENAESVQGRHTVKGVLARVSLHRRKFVWSLRHTALACWTEPGRYTEIQRGEHILVPDIGGKPNLSALVV